MLAGLERLSRSVERLLRSSGPGEIHDHELAAGLERAGHARHHGGILGGVLEIADVFAVNKADREGAAKLVNELRAMLDMSTGDWKPRIFSTVARDDVGIAELLAGIYQHRQYFHEKGLDQVKFKSNVRQELYTYLMDGIVELANSTSGFEQLVKDIYRKALTPLEGAEKLFAEMGIKNHWLITGGDDAEKN